MGLDETLFEECMLGEDAAAIVEADLEQGLALGVRATPTFFLGTVGADGVVELTTRIRGQVTLEGIQDVLAEEGGGVHPGCLGGEPGVARSVLHGCSVGNPRCQ